MKTQSKTKTKTKLETWLDKATTVPKDELIVPYYSIYTKDAYYTSKDVDIDLRNNNMSNDMNEYMDHTYINPRTNRYHANMLFRMMIDYSYESGFDYELHDPETKNSYLKFNLMDKSLKESFYKFCYEN